MTRYAWAVEYRELIKIRVSFGQRKVKGTEKEKYYEKCSNRKGSKGQGCLI